MIKKIEIQLNNHTMLWSACKQCRLGKLATNHILYETFEPAEDLKRIDFMFIGDMPKVKDDVKARPFMSKDGKLLRKVIDKNNRGRYSYILTNVVACITPEGRKPKYKTEIPKCRPRVEQLIRIIKPRVIILLGIVAQNYIGILLKEMNYTVPLVKTDHPSFILEKGLDSREYELYADFFEGIFRIGATFDR